MQTPAASACARQRGHSLLELLVVLVIAGVLFSVAVPGMARLVAGQRADAAVAALTALVNVARHAAAWQRTTVTVCAASGNDCLGRDSWQHGAAAFIDANRNHRIDAAETVLARLPPLRPGSRLVWRSFRNLRVLRFTPTGITPWQNGHFQYCPPDGDATLARQVVLNAAGRLRRARDSNRDGIVEDARGRPLTCNARRGIGAESARAQRPRMAAGGKISGCGGQRCRASRTRPRGGGYDSSSRWLSGSCSRLKITRSVGEYSANSKFTFIPTASIVKAP